MTLSFPVEPMKGVLGSLPADPTGWSFEVKWDGYRTLAFVDGDELRLQSTSGLDVTSRYPELAGLPAAVNADRAVLDGEVVVLDDDGRPRFELLQRHERPAVLFVFDVLSIDGADTIGLAYEDRRTLLESLVEPGDHWAVPAHHPGDGAALLEATAARGLEGVMAKRLGSTYRPGARSRDWVKIKHRVPLDVVIGGYTKGTGHRAATFGALLVGRRDDTSLTFAGGVGTGFTQATLDSLADSLRALETDTCPFDPPPPASYRRGATWVRPELVARVEIAELTDDGLVRHASFVELVDEADEVR